MKRNKNLEFSNAGELAKFVFHCLDDDGSGELDYAELKDGLPSFDVYLTGDEFKIITRFMDPDQDESISIQEWSDFMMATEEELSHGGWQEGIVLEKLQGAIKLVLGVEDGASLEVIPLPQTHATCGLNALTSARTHLRAFRLFLWIKKLWILKFYCSDLAAKVVPYALPERVCARREKSCIYSKESHLNTTLDWIHRKSRSGWRDSSRASGRRQAVMGAFATKPSSPPLTARMACPMWRCEHLLPHTRTCASSRRRGGMNDYFHSGEAVF